MLQEDNVVPARWVLAKVTQIYVSDDGVVGVVRIKTPQGVRPATKVALLLP